MDLSHYTATPFTLDRQRVYAQSVPPYTYSKPVGLWVSADGPDDWYSWCVSEEFRLDRLECRSIVTLAPDANMLVLTSPEAILEFEEKYGDEDPTLGPILGSRYVAIDWPRVTQEYDGIIIAPYQWSLRYHCNFYYPWDVASGCIWNLNAIASTRAGEPRALEVGTGSGEPGQCDSVDL
jgi:hypothetical protein